jgi:hypothetical protein
MNTEDLQQQITTHYFRKYRDILVIKTHTLSLSRVRPNTEYGTGKEREEMAQCGGTRHDQGEIATRECTVQPKRLASQENCGAKLLHQDESVPVFHLDCAAVSLFLESFFSFLIAFLFFLFSFLF